MKSGIVSLQERRRANYTSNLKVWQKRRIQTPMTTARSIKRWNRKKNNVKTISYRERASRILSAKRNETHQPKMGIEMLSNWIDAEMRKFINQHQRQFAECSQFLFSLLFCYPMAFSVYFILHFSSFCCCCCLCPSICVWTGGVSELFCRQCNFVCRVPVRAPVPSFACLSNPD